MGIPSASRTDTIDVAIASGASLSGAINLGNRVVTGVLMPAAWTAADLTFQASVDGATFADLYDAAGNEYTVVAAAARFIPVPPSTMAGVTHIKVRSGAAAAAVNQAAARTIYLVGRDID